MTLGKKIKELRKNKGMSQEELGQKIGVQKATIYKYENGIVCNLKQSTIKTLADVLGTTPSYLMGWEDKDDTLKASISREVPILGTIAAGEPMFAEQNIEGYTSTSNKDIDFSLIVKGDSMTNARIANGDLVLVDKDAPVENGDIVVALVNGDEATVKRFYKHGKKVYLRPENPSYKEQEYDAKEVTLLGKVKEIKILLP